MTLEHSLAMIADRHDCEVYPPVGQPMHDGFRSLPSDIAAFYSLCGGVLFHASSQRLYLWRIVAPNEFKPACYSVYGGSDEDIKLLGHWSDTMFLFATTQHGEERIVVDCGGRHHGLFFNGDHETYATDGMLLVSKSLPELLAGLAQCEFEHLPHLSSLPLPIRLRDL